MSKVVSDSGSKIDMNGENEDRSEADRELEREIRRDRKFTLAEAIGRMAGPGGLKGESPVTRLQQMEFEIASWLRTHLADAGGLEVVLRREIRESEFLLKNLEQPPLVVLASYLERLLESDNALRELVRNADVEWGRTMDERPHFERDGAPPHPDDPYTIDSVRTLLTKLIKELA